MSSQWKALHSATALHANFDSLIAALLPDGRPKFSLKLGDDAFGDLAERWERNFAFVLCSFRCVQESPGDGDVEERWGVIRREMMG